MSNPAGAFTNLGVSTLWGLHDEKTEGKPTGFWGKICAAVGVLAKIGAAAGEMSALGEEGQRLQSFDEEPVNQHRGKRANAGAHQYVSKEMLAEIDT
jgi:hypothetical protein